MRLRGQVAPSLPLRSSRNRRSISSSIDGSSRSSSQAAGTNAERPPRPAPRRATRGESRSSALRRHQRLGVELLERVTRGGDGALKFVSIHSYGLRCPVFDSSCPGSPSRGSSASMIRSRSSGGTSGAVRTRSTRDAISRRSISILTCPRSRGKTARRTSGACRTACAEYRESLPRCMNTTLSRSPNTPAIG